MKEGELMSTQWDKDIEFTYQMVQKLILHHFPDFNCKEVQLLDEGWDNYIFVVNNEVVFRFPRRKVAVELIKMEIIFYRG
ncbi:MAG: hypothetical protein LRY71_07230 [Bacillaceae bacterium]|nr:hypothetical protein [Bacillaceae bacterium]